MSDARRVRSPKILTKLHRYLKLWQLLAAKNKISIYRHLLSIFQCDICAKVFSRCKMPCLIKLIVVWQKCLWHHGKHLSARYDCRHIIEHAVYLIWKPYEKYAVKAPAVISYSYKLILCCSYELILPEKILTGVSGNAKLRENNHLCPVVSALLHKSFNKLSVVYSISYLYLWCRCSDLYISVLQLAHLLQLIHRKLICLITELALYLNALAICDNGIKILFAKCGKCSAHTLL